MASRSPILVEPSFDTLADAPDINEVLSGWLKAINFLSDRRSTLTALNFGFHFSTAILFTFFVVYYLSPETLIFVAVALVVIGTIYNTIWYHRYCSHSAIKFSRPGYTSLFLWTNPLAFAFREETYAIPHQIHHQRTDRAGDPYGPHLGWLASYLSTEVTQRLNSNITEREFELLKSTISHIGLETHSYARFRQTGSIETLKHYVTRATASQLFWIAIVALIGWHPYVVSYYAAIFIASALIRDFNWRGHGGNFRKNKRPQWEFDIKSRALNQHFYGYIASEWHDNHHKYPFSANSGFLPGQFDLAFQIIRLMHRLSIVESYIDARPIFEKECLCSALRA